MSWINECTISSRDTYSLVYRWAYLSLVTLSTDNSHIRDVLIRLALGHNTGPGLALFYALLAFSSLRKDRLSQQALQLKIAALECLAGSSNKGLWSFREAAQHVAASMLLGAFEVGNLLTSFMAAC